MLLRKIWFVAAKDLLQLRHDRSAFIFMFAVPLFLMGILGSVFSGFGASTLTVRIPVVNRDGGSGAAALMSSLRNDPSIRVKVATDLKDTKKAVRDGTDVGVLIIPRGFTAAVNGLSHNAKLTYYTVSNNNGADAQLARGTVQSIVQRFAFRAITASVIAQAQLHSAGKASRMLTAQLTAEANRRLDRNPPISLATVSATGQKYNFEANVVPGYALMFALFAVTGGAATILKEKERGTFKRLLIAPLPPSALLGGKLLAQFIQTFVQLTLLFALGIFIFKVSVGPSIPSLLLLIVATSFAATGVGLILVSVVKSQAQLRPITTLVVLSFSALGGSWWPIAAEPHWMQNLAKVTLNSWAMSGFNGLMIFDKDLGQVLPDIVALFAYGLVCFAVARRTFRFRET